MDSSTIASLQIGEESLHIILKSGNNIEREWNLPIGIGIISKFFKHDMPQWNEIEYAINFIEDTIVPISKDITPGTSLISMDKSLLNIAKLLDGNAQLPFKMTTEAVESVFTRWGFLVSGRPSSTDSIPEDTTFAVRLLLLREVLHHLKFESILLS